MSYELECVGSESSLFCCKMHVLWRQYKINVHARPRVQGVVMLCEQVDSD
jgi:hypothetical protein